MGLSVSRIPRRCYECFCFVLYDGRLVYLARTHEANSRPVRSEDVRCNPSRV
jgi:hypothetical protein